MKFSLQTLLLTPLALIPLFVALRSPASTFGMTPMLAGAALFITYVSIATSIVLARRILARYNSRNIISDGLRTGAVAGIACLIMKIVGAMDRLDDGASAIIVNRCSDCVHD